MKYFHIKQQNIFKKNDLTEYNILNFYGWGGFLIWKLSPDFKVFIDGRANTVYTETVYDDYRTIENGEDGYRELLDKYKIDGALLTQIHPVSINILQDNNWELIFSDELSLFLIKKSILKNKNIKKNLLPWNYYLERGTSQRKDKNFFESLISFKIAEKITPKRGEVNLSLGLLLSEMGDNKNALLEFKKSSFKKS